MAHDDEMPPSFPPEKIPGIADVPASAPPNAEDEADEAAVAQEERRRSKFRGLVETVVIIACALLASVVIKTYFIQAFWVPSGSMETTLMPDDRIAVNRLANTASEIHRGDVVVFTDPGGWLTSAEASQVSGLTQALQKIGLVPEDAGQHLVKRVIGVGGDTVECCTVDGRLTVNGRAITETYLDPGTEPSTIEFSVRVPQGTVWVMGDNRANSRDSRYHMSESGGGFVPVSDIVGRAWLIFYPISRFGTLPDASSVFSAVP